MDNELISSLGSALGHCPGQVIYYSDFKQMQQSYYGNSPYHTHSISSGFGNKKKCFKDELRDEIDTWLEPSGVN